MKQQKYSKDEENFLASMKKMQEEHKAKIFKGLPTETHGDTTYTKDGMQRYTTNTGTKVTINSGISVSGGHVSVSTHNSTKGKKEISSQSQPSKSSQPNITSANRQGSGGSYFFGNGVKYEGGSIRIGDEGEIESKPSVMRKN